MNIHRLYRPFLKHFRTKRMRQFQAIFQPNGKTRILDVGGGEFNWLLLSGQPQLTFLNIAIPKERTLNASWLIADGRHLPFKDGAFDIAYSNSVIEHLSNFENQRCLAAEIQRVAHQYYVQTPNKWFPIEPHLLTPFIHWLPHRWRQRLIRNFTLWGLITRPTKEKCRELVDEIRLLDESQLQHLFPDAHIQREYAFGLTKSLIAIKVAGSQ
jgi:ubiquinone/menaquinone biosynthesis C-methylase UbiE